MFEDSVGPQAVQGQFQWREPVLLFCPVPWPSSGEGPGTSGSLGFPRRQAFGPGVATVSADTEWRAAAKVGTNLEMLLIGAQNGGHRAAEHKDSVLSSPETPTPGSLGELREIARRRP